MEGAPTLGFKVCGTGCVLLRVETLMTFCDWKRETEFISKIGIENVEKISN